MDKKELAKQQMIKTVEKELPDFVEAVKHDGADKIVFHQAAFAADYQEEEFRLLGMAIKYAGLHGKEIMIVPHKE